jgi:hypothetical protein
MLLEDFNTQFRQNVQGNNVSGVRDTIMRELGRILVDDKQDFVNLLRESGIDASPSDSTMDLIDAYSQNIPNNKKLMLGSSLLVQQKNKVVGADGTSQISDSNVKVGYEVLKSCFDAESYSNAVDPVTAIAEAVGKLAETQGKGIDLAHTVVKGKQQQKFGGQQLAAQQNAAKTSLLQAAFDYKKSKGEKEGGSKTGIILGVAGLLVVGIIIAVVVVKRRNK